MNYPALRRRILDVAHTSQAGHIPSAFSVLEIIGALYERMTADDVFILSKGHGALAWYAVLEALGKLPNGSLDKFCHPDGVLGGHPDCNASDSITATSGSLGHGLAIACGRAWAKRIAGERGTVYVVCGDGEMQEGSAWEAVDLAVQLGLVNLVCIIDHNRTHDTAERLPIKMRAAGWGITTCGGHNLFEIVAAAIDRNYHDNPLAVIAYTVKGKGIAEMERNPGAWHHRAPNDDEYERFKAELCAPRS